MQRLLHFGRSALRVAAVIGLLSLAGPPTVDAAAFGAPWRFDTGRSWGLRLGAGASGDLAAAWRTDAGLWVARSAAGRWRLDQPGGPGGFGDPLMVVTPDGETTLAVETADDQGIRQISIWLARRGQDFAQAVTLRSGSSRPGGSIRPALAVTKSGNVLLAWTRRTARDAGDVMLTTFSAGGRPLSTPRRIGRSSADGASIVPAANGAVVTWLSGRHRRDGRSVRSLLARRLDVRGRPVGPRAIVTPSATPAAVSAGRAGGAAAIAWSAYDRRTRRTPLFACRLVGTPVHCAHPTRLAEDVGGSDRPSVAVGPGARAAVAWVAPAAAGRAAVPRVTTLAPSGRWTEARDVSAEPRSAVWASALVPAADGTFLVGHGQNVRRLGSAGWTGPVERLDVSAPTDGPVRGAAGGGQILLGMTTDAYRGGGFPVVWTGSE